MKNQKYSGERANYPFLPDVDEIEYKNKLTDLICDKILNYDGKSKFGGEKMQKVAEIVLKSKSLIDNNTKLQPMKVETQVHIYEIDGKDTKVGEEKSLNVRNVLNRRRLVELQVGSGEKIAVHESELIKAIANATDNEI